MQRYLPDTQEGISICNIPLVSLYAPAKAYTNSRTIGIGVSGLPQTTEVTVCIGVGFFMKPQERRSSLFPCKGKKYNVHCQEHRLVFHYS